MVSYPEIPCLYMYFYGAERSYCNLEVSIISYAIIMSETTVSYLPQPDFDFPREICHRNSCRSCPAPVLLLLTVTHWPCQTLHCTPQIKSSL